MSARSLCYVIVLHPNFGVLRPSATNMTKSGVAFLDLPIWARVQRGVLNSLVGNVVGVPLFLLESIDGRFWRYHGVVQDTWLHAALLPVALGLGGAVAALFGQWWKNRWTAAIAFGVSALPLNVLFSVDHSGPGAPYIMQWPLAFGLCGLFAVITLMRYNYTVRRIQELKERKQQEREAPV